MYAIYVSIIMCNRYVCKCVCVCVCVCVRARAGACVRAYFTTCSTDADFGIKEMCLTTCSCLKLSHHFNILQPLKFVNTIHLHSVYASVQWGKKVLNYIKHELKIVTITYCFLVRGALFQIIFDILRRSSIN
jgi:hypothetical protein